MQTILIMTKAKAHGAQLLGHVLDFAFFHEKRQPLIFCQPSDLPERRPRVRDVVDDAVAHHRVEVVVRERQGLRIDQLEVPERAQRGVEVRQCYATADLGLIGYETESRQGLVVDESVIVEIVRPGTCEPVSSSSEKIIAPSWLRVV